MKKTRKLLSILLSFTIVISMVLSSTNVYAAGWLDQVSNIDLDTIYTEQMDTTDYCTNYKDGYYMDSFRFVVPLKGTINFNFVTECRDYIYKGTGVQENYPTYIYFYSSEDLNNEIFYWNIHRNFNQATGEYYDSFNVNLPKGGTYYLVIKYKAWCYYYNGGAFNGTYDFSLNYKPSLASVASLKTSSRGVNSLKLSWSKVGNVSGYQLQRKSGSTYKTITNTTSTSYTVKNLSSATSYTFRVRAYKTVNGKKYYSSWKTLTTPTKPSKVSIKTPATNSKHQIIAKWYTVARANGYQVQYCRNKSCSDVIATKTVSGQSKSSYTGKNFTKGRTYYVRVRAYKTVNNKKYYGAWSNIKSIKSK